MTQTLPSRQSHYTAGETSDLSPVIGIPCYASKHPRTQLALFGTNQAYVQALLLAGATPLLIPHGTSQAKLNALWRCLDGVFLPGGIDLHPETYHEQPHPLLGAVDRAEDALDLALARGCLEANVPLFGENRGCQVINIACGGTLLQDIRAQRRGAWQHATIAQPRSYLAHVVNIHQATRLAAVLGTAPLMVNSFHHQAVKGTGVGVRIAAEAPDGIIEAVEVQRKRFALGVQWSADALAVEGDRRMLALFRGFVEAARAYRQAHQQMQMQARALKEHLEGMLERDLATLARVEASLFADPSPLDVLEELEARMMRPQLQGRVRAAAEALALPDPLRAGGQRQRGEA